MFWAGIFQLSATGWSAMVICQLQQPYQPVCQFRVLPAACTLYLHAALGNLCCQNLTSKMLCTGPLVLPATRNHRELDARMEKMDLHLVVSSYMHLA